MVTEIKDPPPVSPTFQPLRPSLPTTVQLGLTIAYIVVFSVIFIAAYVQLWMIWYYRHKRLSHQTIFLFLCLVWAGLRTSLFSFYFRDSVQSNELDIALYLLLYSLPVCLQFCMLCLLLHFFLQVVLKARAKFEPRQHMHPLHIFIGASVLLFLAVNIACAILTRKYQLAFASVPMYLIYVRVALSETMFFVYGVLLSISIFKITKMTSTQRVLEAKGTTVCKAVAAAIAITLLFLSRTIYNLISVCSVAQGTPNFGFDWINVTDQADAVSRLSASVAYVSFGIVLFVWEVLPISIVVIFFRVKRLNAGVLLTDFSSHSSGPRVFFFDNPRRYDSEDSLFSQTSSQSNTAGSHSHSSGSTYSSTHRKAISNSVGSNSATTPSQTSSPSTASSLPSNSSVLNYKKGIIYGAVGRETKVELDDGNINRC